MLDIIRKLRAGYGTAVKIKPYLSREALLLLGAPQIIACAPQARNVPPPSEDCALKESSRPSAMGWHFETVLPQITVCAPQNE